MNLTRSMDADGPFTGALGDLWPALEAGWLGERSPEFRDMLRRHCTMREFETGEYTHHIGDAPGGIYGVLDGSFGVQAISEAVGVVMGHIYQAGGWFGQGPMTTGKPRYLAFRAMEPSRVAILPLDRIERIVNALPDARREFMSLSEYNQVLMARAISDLLIRKSDLRIASVLLRILDLPGVTPERTRSGGCTVTQSELSEMANVSRHTANTVLRRFAAEGWIELGYGRISLSDAAGLRAFAFGGD